MLLQGTLQRFRSRKKKKEVYQVHSLRFYLLRVSFLSIMALSSIHVIYGEEGVPALLFCKHRARLWTLMDDNVAPAFPRDIDTKRQGTHDLVQGRG